MADQRIFTGTAGWSYADWEGVVYPATTGAGKLQTVARYLDCVEVDSSFYRPPTAPMTATWVKNVSTCPDFKFLAKAWQRFTHERSARWSQAEFDLFAEGLRPLRDSGRLEAVLFQFPWSFRRNEPNRQWLQSVVESFRGWPVAVELRHDSWLTDETFDFLRQHRATFCNIDQPALNHCLPPTAHATSDVGYYRLHGRNAQNWFREKQEAYGGRYDYLYSAAELDDVFNQMMRLAKQTKKTFVIFNNHKDGKAFANALQIKARLNPRVVPQAPVSARQKFPTLQGCTRADGEEQLPLV